MKNNRTVKYEKFRQLHSRSKTFVLPNAWDAGSAAIYQQSGFEAIGTTSAGMAVSLGYPDGENLPFDKLLEALRSIVNAVDVPISADIEAGYGKSVQEVRENVRQIISTGVVGINLEDGTGNPDAPIYDLSLQCEKIAAIKELCDSLKMPLFVNARTDLFWLNIGNPEERLIIAINRCKAYQEAGADSIFVPGLKNTDAINILRQEISIPINLLIDAETPSLQMLSEIGIERVSTGSAPFRATVTFLKRVSEDIIKRGDFQQIADGVISYHELAK
ncbi:MULTISPECIES: isocitrate lyase/PEP mutase family protein [Bacillus]|uniref:Dihydrouridine synthase n=2 Tax=Bacillus TaxID=1386 RepID=A0A0M4G0G0_9BACI|nr:MULTISPECIES: isocitrate lyase/phosphoenolpyruvate mutase family protein [Bacillus]ALC83525.1 dihydrouridine synthase [Bacillus gobiensis]MBP1082507.1 2-methylisocitrate lyase-like PEP mutase family enzyme [Bacillus capparidis]MED1097259.1 isocitrate lyase/phosphoenolpyruvate mutase family protein [Bacillus capparidis]